MEEHEVIANTVAYLIKKENAEVSKISTRKIQHDTFIKDILLNSDITIEIIDKIQFKRNEEDIIAYFKFETGRRQKYLEIEAKGGNIYYNFYTCLGQFICLKKSPSTYYWFAFALPFSWREELRKRLRNSDGKIKPIVKDIIEKYTKNGQGLWFYFIKNDGTVIKETWRQTLK